MSASVVMEDGTEELEPAVKYILDGSLKLQCSVVTRTKALLIYHNFMKCVLDVKYYDPHLVAASCLSSSIKYAGDRIDFDAVILVFVNMKEKCNSLQSIKFKMMKESVFSINMLMLRFLEFDISHPTVHDFLPFFKNEFAVLFSYMDAWEVFSTTCMRLACDFYLTSRCLAFKAEEIALAVIKASLHFSGVNLDDSCNFKYNLKAFHSCNEKRVQVIMEAMLETLMIGMKREI